MNKPLFVAFFENDEVFKGGDLLDSKWKDIPNKKIKTLYYLLPSGDYISLSGYDKYYHAIEATKDILGGKKTNQVTPEYIYVMGNKGDMYNAYRINLKNGAIDFRQGKMNDEFIKKFNQDFWK